MEKLKTFFDDSNTINEKAVIGGVTFVVWILIVLTICIIKITKGSCGLELSELNPLLIFIGTCFGISSVEKILVKKQK